MPTDEQLMIAYLAGDARAFESLFRRYAPLLTGYFQRHGKCPEDARDLVQQTFLHVHRSRLDFDPAEPVRPWLFAIARNVCLDHCRRQLRRPEWLADLDLQAAPPPTACSISCAQRVSALWQALGRLSGRDRALIDAHFLEERSFEQLAARDGVPSTTLRVRAHRACARLRTFIDPVHATAA